jgi:hypothetical protein
MAYARFRRNRADSHVLLLVACALVSARAAGAEAADPPETEPISSRHELRVDPIGFVQALARHDLFELFAPPLGDSQPDAETASQPSISWLGGRFRVGRVFDGTLEDGRERDLRVPRDWEVKARIAGPLHGVAELRFHAFGEPEQDLGAGLGLRYEF